MASNLVSIYFLYIFITAQFKIFNEKTMNFFLAHSHFFLAHSHFLFFSESSSFPNARSFFIISKWILWMRWQRWCNSKYALIKFVWSFLLDIKISHCQTAFDTSDDYIYDWNNIFFVYLLTSLMFNDLSDSLTDWLAVKWKW